MADLASLTIKPLISPHGLFVSRRPPENNDETHLNFYLYFFQSVYVNDDPSWKCPLESFNAESYVS